MCIQIEAAIILGGLDRTYEESCTHVFHVKKAALLIMPLVKVSSDN